MLHGRQRLGAPSRRVVRTAVQPLSAHEAHHLAENPPRAGDDAGGSHHRPRLGGTRPPRGRAYAGRPLMTTIPPLPLSLPLVMIEPAVRAALLEDLGRAGDLTTDSIVP